ncbi:ABC transporter ATP-binding protein [Claveliimonas bilis]|uniref:Multidrug ABC transporter ATP-binding protein n=1 Tax=Claveliimonas bilis TaxID=3028070 RepID=A0ABM8I3U9_9FIRM|nr:ABC transporter ATP-binding protein [Claveliimonas bilis]BDZ76803.1 multidrug ABC transporter ATP-binding protein [Claveliimonas bilis]
MTHAIEVSALTKTYGEHQVLKGIDLHVRKGEIFALLGVNGAGKTTALECIEDLKKYDSGSITVIGRTGIQLQSSSLPEHIKTMEAIRLFSQWNRSPLPEETLHALGIYEFSQKQYFQLSTGQKRRLHLALSLIRDPDILFLDEPTAGLDVEGRLLLHQQIRQLNAMGKTIVLASHDMTEVENLCDRIAILSGGRIAFTGTVEQLQKRMGKHYNITIRTNAGTERYESDSIENTLFELLIKHREKSEAILDIQVNRGSLEQHFMKIAKEG